MVSRFSAARPKRAAEYFARTHHGQKDHEGQSSPKKVKFDVRNPSALAPASRDQDDEDYAAELEGDTIGAGAGGAKRGAVNIDGYESDSDNETFGARAWARRSRGHCTAGDDGHADVLMDIAEQLDSYGQSLRVGDGDDADMFAAEDDEGLDEDGRDGLVARKHIPRRAKDVRFLDAEQIEGQEQASRSGGTVRLDEREASSDDEDDLELAIQEEGIDQEVGMGGLKRNAPKIDAFNMKAEQEEGAFDEAGNFIRKAVDPDAVHDRWLEGVSKKEMKRAAVAHEKREKELRRKRKEDDSVMTEDLLKSLILNLERDETPIEALARLGKANKKEKRVPRWKLKKLEKKIGGEDEGEAMDLDATKEAKDSHQVNSKTAINAITEAADRLLCREYTDVYETERRYLIRDWQVEAAKRWTEPEEPPTTKSAGTARNSKNWEYRWTDGRDGGVIQGPYGGPAMKAWQEAGYFDGADFRAVGEDEWSRSVEFV